MSLKRILTCQAKNPIANLAWLALLGFAVYVFIFVNYVLSQGHGLRNFYPDSNVVWDFIALWVLLMEFMLNFPSRYWYVRLWMGIFAILVLLCCLPTL